MAEKTLLFDETVLSNGLRNNSACNGIFSTAFNLLDRFIHDDRVDVVVYSFNDDRALVKQMIEQKTGQTFEFFPPICLFSPDNV